MRLEIYNDTTPETEKVLRLRLHRDYEGSPIWLTAVDERGKALSRGHILRFNPDGRIQRCFGVEPAFGFDLDAQDRVKVD